MAVTTPATPSRSPSSWAVAPRVHLVDAGLWLVACLPVFASPFVDDHEVDVVMSTTMVAALVLIVARHRWPIPALGVGLVAMLAATAASGRPTALMPAVVVLLYEVAVRHDRRLALRAGFAGVTSVLAAIAILVSTDFLGPELLAGVAWPTLAVAAGDAVRSRREAIAAAEERAARAEATREEEARRRVVEERLHIARELHDVVAHQIAVINVQAGVAAHLVDTRPDDARVALSTVRDAARQVLDELAGLLGVLRSPDQDDTATEPAPTLDDLPALVRSFEQAGLRVECTTTGEAHPLQATAATALFRTVQEALTNAHRHGDGTARLRIAHLPDAIEVVITNRVPATAADRRPEPPSSGFGLIGMRERIATAGGRLQVGTRPGGEFVVEAQVPRPPSQEVS